MKLETLSLAGEVAFTKYPSEGGLPEGAIHLELVGGNENPSAGSIFDLEGQQYVCLSVSKIQWLPFFESFGRVIVARPV